MWPWPKLTEAAKEWADTLKTNWGEPCYIEDEAIDTMARMIASGDDGSYSIDSQSIEYLDGGGMLYLVYLLRNGEDKGICLCMEA